MKTPKRYTEDGGLSNVGIQQLADLLMVVRHDDYSCITRALNFYQDLVDTEKRADARAKELVEADAKLDSLYSRVFDVEVERDEAHIMVDKLRDRIDTITREHDKARAQLAAVETERGHWRDDCDALLTRLDEAEAELAALNGKEQAAEPDDEGWQENTGECPDVKRVDIRLQNGGCMMNVRASHYHWELWEMSTKCNITHWRPARGVR